VIQPVTDSIYYLLGTNAFIMKKNNLLGVYYEGQELDQVSYKYKSVNWVSNNYFYPCFLLVTTKEGKRDILI
jgi:hypothetical protein